MKRQDINTGQRLSPSARQIIKLRKRASQSGGGSLELQIPTNYIRDISRDLNYDITSDASLIMTPNTIGEGRLFNCKPELRNKLIRSEEFDNASWTNNFSTITANSATDPNGNTTADLWNITTPSNGTLSQTVLGGFTAGFTYTLSCYVKAFDGSQIGKNIALRMHTAPFTQSQITLTGGWDRISTTVTITNNETALVFRLLDFSVSNAATAMYVWGAQLELGSTATAYQRTTDGITDFQATRATTATVIQKDGSIGESCYNLATNSENITTANVFWNYTSNVNSTANAVTDPLGGNGGDKYSPTAAANRLGFNNTVKSMPVNTIISTSIYAKSGESSIFKFGGIFSVGSQEYVTFNTNTGTYSFTGSNVISAKMEIADYGYYKCSVIYRFTNFIGNNFLYCGIFDMVSSTYNGTDGMYFWGFQIAQSDKYLPYLKTTNRQAVPSISYTLGSNLPALLVEPARTNIVFPSATATTQSRTVTAQPYTLSFYGTGTVDLTGTHTATIVGLGATTLKTYTFTPTAGTLTFTITGTVTDWQCEAGSNYTSRIVTTTATATRNNYTSFVDLFNNNALNKDNFTLFVEGYLRFGDATTNISFGLSDTTATGARANDIGFFDGIKATYAVGSTITSDTTNISNENYYKFAIQRSGTSVKFFRNGAQIWNTQTIAVFDYRYLILNTGGSTFMVQKVALWKTTKSDSDCITLTA